MLEEIFQYTIPYFHPLAVHFPIAFLLMGIGTAFLYLLLNTSFWKWVTVMLLLLGFVGAFAAIQTGESLEEDVEGEDMAELFLEPHEEAAEWTLWSAGAALFAFAGFSIYFYRKRNPHRRTLGDPLWVRLLLFLLCLNAGIGVAYTGHLGALMVWGTPVT